MKEKNEAGSRVYLFSGVSRKMNLEMKRGIGEEGLPKALHEGELQERD